MLRTKWFLNIERNRAIVRTKEDPSRYFHTPWKKTVHERWKYRRTAHSRGSEEEEKENGTQEKGIVGYQYFMSLRIRTHSRQQKAPMENRIHKKSERRGNMLKVLGELRAA